MEHVAGGFVSSKDQSTQSVLHLLITSSVPTIRFLVYRKLGAHRV